MFMTRRKKRNIDVELKNLRFSDAHEKLKQLKIKKERSKRLKSCERYIYLSLKESFKGCIIKY